MSDDIELLRRYATSESEGAFAELVGRHLPLVYSAALRQVGGDEELAKDVAQSVFIDLARKAGSVSQRGVLAGWLYTSARFAAAKAVRTDQRRRRREQSFASMQDAEPQPVRDADWDQLRPVVDEAMAELPVADRNAILLRIFQRKELKAVGSALGVGEDAARMRVNRALESLRDLLKQRGVAISAAALGTILTAEAVAAPPLGLAVAITGAAMAGAAAGTTTVTVLNLMTMTKAKAAVLSLIVVAGVTTPLVVQHQSLTNLRQENQSLRAQAGQVTSLTAQTEQLSNLLAQARSSAAVANDQQRELLRLRGEVGLLRKQSGENEKLQQQIAQLKAALAANRASVPVSASAGEISFPRESWAFAGYATPEAALQSGIWALSKADVKTLLGTLTPRAAKQMGEALKANSETQILSQFPFNLLSQSTALRIARKEVVSDNEVNLELAIELPQQSDSNAPGKPIPLAAKARKVGNEWKLEPGMN